MDGRSAIILADFIIFINLQENRKITFAFAMKYIYNKNKRNTLPMLKQEENT